MDIKKTNLKFRGILSNRKITKYIIYHHAEHGNCSVYDIHQWHLNNGWSGIGYNFFVKKDGSTWEGRPENKIGAHALGYNDISIGICAEGKYMIEDMPEAQKKALIELGIYLKNKYNINPNNIIGHRDVNSTTCPGSKYPLEEIKQAIIKGEASSNSFIKIDGGSKQVDDKVGINLIIRDFSSDIISAFGYVDDEKSASWAFNVKPLNTNYTKLEKNCSKLISSRASGNVFKPSVWYKIKVKGYNSSGKHVATAILPLKGIQVNMDHNTPYKVQVGSFRNKTYAENLRDELKEKGYKDTYIQEKSNLRGSS